MISKQTEEELIRKEQEIVAASRRGDFAAVAALLADDFLEIGSSGRLYSKTEVLDALREVAILDCSFRDFRALPLGPDCVILTYVTEMRRRQQGRDFPQRSYRSSTWVRRDSAWCVVFHQASVLPPE